MSEYVDSAVQTVLSSSRLKLAHPGNAKLTQVYPTPSETTSVLAQAINHRGQFRVASNSKNFNSRSDFILSSSALISEMAIVGDFTYTNTAAGTSSKPSNEGWAFDLVESIEITYSNSLMQNMFIKGETLRDYSLLCCCSARERQDMLRAAGSLSTHGAWANNAACTMNFILPLSFLNHTVGSLRNSWPVDGSVLAGPIQIAINWRPASAALVRAGAAGIPALPASFNNLNLVCKTTQLQDASFSVKKAMMLDPQLVYSLPARYITTVDYSKEALRPNVIQTINLASAPSGMLEGIIISIRPKMWKPLLTMATQPIPGSCTLDYLQLEFGGQNIFRCESYEEISHYLRNTYGDSSEYTNHTYTLNQIPNFAAVANTVSYQSMVYFIPLVNDGKAVFRGHTNENLPSYGGSQLQLKLRAASNQKISAIPGTYEGAQAYVASVSAAGGGVEGYEILVGYVVSALLEISQGTVDLQL